MADTLKPCPFCDGPASETTGADFIGCQSCDVWADDPAAWNRRATPAAAPATPDERLRDAEAALHTYRKAYEELRARTEGEPSLTVRERAERVAEWLAAGKRLLGNLSQAAFAEGMNEFREGVSDKRLFRDSDAHRAAADAMDAHIEAIAREFSSTPAGAPEPDWYAVQWKDLDMASWRFCTTSTVRVDAYPRLWPSMADATSYASEIGAVNPGRVVRVVPVYFGTPAPREAPTGDTERLDNAIRELEGAAIDVFRYSGTAGEKPSLARLKAARAALRTEPAPATSEDA